MNETENYCEICDSCGEPACCPPIKCAAVKCKYGEINLKDYRNLLEQWSVMLEALENLVKYEVTEATLHDALAAIAKAKGETK
jgi:ArsR family metal-binding transcriptional regulator